MSIPIHPIGPFRATIRPPGSKSLTNRALLLAALAQGGSTLRGILLADDSERMLEALAQLGFAVAVDRQGRTARVSGLGGELPPQAARGAGETVLYLGNAGTAYRFLTAACCLRSPAPAPIVLDGIKRMRERPIGQLVEALHELGGRVAYRGRPNFPPLAVEPRGLDGGELTMPATLSSQYLSALLQVAPCCQRGLTLRFTGPVTSRPYVEMTLALMQRFGIQADVDAGFTRITVAPGTYRAGDYHIEPDASSASYFLAAAAIVPGSTCTIEGLGKDSVQGDVRFADVLHQMGAGLLFGRDFITVMGPPPGQRLRGIDADLNAMPDMAQTLAAVALFARGPTTIRNVGNLRVKETDRLAALRAELTRMGARAEIEGDDLSIEPPPNHRILPAAIETYDDHRMAMSFAVVGLGSPGIVINDPECVNKTFPEFFEYLAQLGRSPAEAPAS